MCGGAQPRHSILGHNVKGVVGVGFKAVDMHSRCCEPTGSRGKAHASPTGLAGSSIHHCSPTLRTPHNVPHILATPHICRGFPSQGELSPQNREAQVSGN